MVPGALVRIPLPFPEIKLPAPGSAPPIMLFMNGELEMSIPVPPSSLIAAVPAALVPMKLPRMKLPVPPNSIPLNPLPEITLRAAAVTPPMRLFEELDSSIPDYSVER